MTYDTTKVYAALLVAVVAIGLAFTGVAIAEDDQFPTNEVELNDEGVHWSGQQVVVEDQELFEDGEVVELLEEEEGFQDQKVIEDGSVTFDTSELEQGDYEVRYQGEIEFTFELRDQEFTTEVVGESQVLNQTETTTEVEISSNRAALYMVEVTAPGLSTDELEAIVEGAEIVEDDEGEERVLVDLTDVNEEELELDFFDVEVAEYDLTFTVLDVGVEDAVTVNVEETPDADAEFTENVFSGTVGDVTEISLSTSGTDEVDLRLVDEDEQFGELYTLEATVENVSGDVDLRFNSYNAGFEAQTLTTGEDEDATVTVTEETILNQPIIPEQYDLRASVDGVQTDRSSLTLGERSSDQINTHTLPRGENPEELDDLDEELLHQTDEVANRDMLVYEVEVNGVFGAFDENVSAEDFSEGGELYENEDMMFEITGEPGRYEEAEQISLSQANLLVDEEEERLLFVVDSTDLEVDERYEARWTLGEDNQYVQQTDEPEENVEELEATAQVTERSVTVDQFDQDDNQIVLSGQDTVEMTGQTSVAPQTELLVFVESGAGEDPLFETAEAVVQNDRTFETEVNVEEISDQTSLEIEFQDLESFDGLYLQAADDEPEEVAFNVVDQDGDVVDIAVVNGEIVNEDGQVTLSTLDEDTTIEYTVEAVGFETVEDSVDAAEFDEVTVELSQLLVNVTFEVTPEDATVEFNDEEVTLTDGEVTFEDVAAQSDYSYTVSADEFQTEEGDVAVGDDDETVVVDLEEVEEDTGETDDETDGEESDEEDGDDETESDGQPGFGIAVALLAIVGAAIIAVRKQNE